jgi:hypothetical protein
MCHVLAICCMTNALLHNVLFYYDGNHIHGNIILEGSMVD